MAIDFINNFFVELWWVISEMSPYLLFGFFIAGLLSIFVPFNLVEKHLGGKGMLPVVKAAVFGVPLPLCSCGVIPVTASLRKNGASRGAAISFLIATPQTGVDSIMATYSLLGPVFAVFRPIAAFVTGIVGGGIADALDKDHPAEGRKSSSHKAISKEESAGKLTRMLKYGFITLPQDIAKPLAVGLIIAAVLTVLIPDNLFAGTFGNGILGMLVMMAIGIPMYVCATASVPIAAALIAKGISPGAALVFLMTGPATNAAAISTVWKTLGKKTAIVYLGTIAAGSLLLGLTLNKIYSAEGVIPGHAGHFMLPLWMQNICGIALVIIILSSLYKIYFPGRKTEKNRQNEKTESMPELILNVKGMTCNHCAMNVKRAIGGVEGIESVEVDIQKGTAEIRGANLQLAAIKKSVEEIGYSIVDKI